MTQHPDHFKFADLESINKAVTDIKKLEEQLSQQAGTPITLIAYEPVQQNDFDPSI